MWHGICKRHELSRHEITVHVDNSYQYQSCNKIFRNSKEFNKHIEAHSSLSHPLFSYLSSNPNSKTSSSSEEYIESNLLECTENEEQEVHIESHNVLITLKNNNMHFLVRSEYE